MDQLNRVQDILKRITYKPGWKIEASRIEKGVRPSVSFIGWERVTILVTSEIEDASNPKINHITLCRYTSLQDYDIERLSDEEVIRYFIHRAIWEMEQHEYHEWFKFDGICVFDPHPELKEKTA
jgi:hypothetical protein